MKLCVNDILYAISYALDCVEKEVLGASTVNHSKRVACISAFIGKEIGLNKYEVLDLASCALLHDNALTEFLCDEQRKKEAEDNSVSIPTNVFKSHCINGEENMKSVPTYGTITNVVKYHHEHVDGSGTFGVSSDETPLYSKIIHLADQIDVLFDFSSINEAKIEELIVYLEATKGSIYCTNIVDLFLKFADIDLFNCLLDDNLDDFIKLILPESAREYDMETIINLVDVFVKIIDYKSEFTQLHTTQLTKKAIIMCEYYKFDELTTLKFYMAAGLHDIGKLAVSSSILEKADKLTFDEFEHIKTHAYQTYNILIKIKHMDDVVNWASFHHEKLNGTGYPFGKTSEQLDDKCRLMACLDIYQALREERSYKKGFDHKKAISILKEMVQDQLIDANIVSDLEIAFG